MDIRKLTHLNWLYLNEMPAAEFGRRVRGFLPACEWLMNAEDGYFLKVCALMQSRASLLSQALEWKYFFVEPPDHDEKAVGKILKSPGVKAALERVRENLGGAEFSAPEIQRAIHAAEAAVGVGEGKLNQPVRVAVTGTSIGAGIYDTLAVLGKARALGRLDYAIGHLCG
jgi:glutamyl/glutaminyl-tRNA synthetase